MDLIEKYPDIFEVINDVKEAYETSLEDAEKAIYDKDKDILYVKKEGKWYQLINAYNDIPDAEEEEITDQDLIDSLEKD